MTQRSSHDKSLNNAAAAGLMLALEPRFMFDAAGVATGADVAAQQIAQDQVDLALPSAMPQELPVQDASTAESQTAIAQNADNSATANFVDTTVPTGAADSGARLAEALASLQGADARLEIVFVDTAVADYQSLLSGIAPNAPVVMLDGSRDGVEQIAETLSHYDRVDAIHLISHGSEGQIGLGSSLLNRETMDGRYAEALKNIGNALTSDADILIYGCDFAAGADGLLAINRLAELTGADVNASTDATGAAAKGGDWVLEAQTGRIESGLILNQTVRESYNALFAATSLTDAGAATIRTTAEDTEIAISGLSIADSDNPAIMTLQLQTTGGTARIAVLGGAGITSGTNASADFTLTGTLAQLNDALATLYYTPALNQNSSTAGFTTNIVLTATDVSNGGSASVTVGNLAVTAVNDAPDLSTGVALTVAEGGNSAFSRAQLASSDNALDPDIASGQQVVAQQMVQITSLPTKGTLTYNNGVVAIGMVVPVTSLANLRYTHNGSDISGNDADSFNVTVSDGGGAATNATLSITITPKNAAPTISGSPSLIEGQVKVVSPSINLGDGFDTLNNATIVIDNVDNGNQGTLFIDANDNNIVDAGEALSGSTTLDAAQRANLSTQLKFLHNGAEPNAPAGVSTPSFRITVTDAGGGEGAGAALSASQTISLSVTPNNDDPTLTNTHATSGTALVVSEGVSVTITNAMLAIADADRDPANTANTTPTNQLVYTIGSRPAQGEIQLNVGGGLGPENDGWIVLGDGGRFTQAQVDAGQVRYYQTTDVSIDTLDGFSFTVRDSAFGYDVWTDPANPTGNREGGLRANLTDAAIAVQQFYLNVAADSNPHVNAYTGGPRPATAGFGGVNMVYSFTPTGGMLSNNSIAGGTWVEANVGAPGGGYVITSAMLSYTITRTDTQGTPAPGDDISVTVPANETVYTLTVQPPNGKVQRLAGGSWVDIATHGQFTQQDIDDGHIRFVHDGGEDHLSTFGYTVSDGTPNHYASTFGLDITPTNDRPSGSGGTAQVTEGNGNAVRLDSSVIGLSDIDNSLDGKAGEGLVDFLWFKIASLAADGGANLRGTLQRWDGASWVNLDTNTWLPATLLTASVGGGTSGLRYVHDGSEPLAYTGGAKVSFTYLVRDDLADPGNAFATNATAPADTSGSQQSNQSNAVTATVNIIPVNNAPQIADKPGDADPDITAIGTIAGGGALVGVNEILANVPEGGTATITSAHLTAVDSDNTTVQRQYRITSAPTLGVLQLNGATLGVGSTFTQADIDAGKLSYKHNGSEISSPTTDALGTYNDKFHFVVNDGVLEDAGADANKNVFLITLTPTNDAPTLISPSASVDIDSADPTRNLISGFAVADPDLTDGLQGGETDFVQVTVRLLDAGGNPITDYVAGFGSAGVSIGYATPTVGGLWAVTRSGSNDVLQIQGTRQQVNDALAGLSVTFVSDLNAMYKVQVIVDDRMRDAGGVLATAAYDANGGEFNQAATAGGSPYAVPNTVYDWSTNVTVPTSGDIAGNLVAKTVDIRASSVNEVATFTGPASVTVNEDTRSPITGFVVSDPESAAFNTPVTVTISVPSGTLGVGTSGAQTSLTPSGGQAVAITGDNSASITLTGRASDIQALLNGRNFADSAADANGGLFYTSAANVNHDLNGLSAGDVTLTLAFNDAGSRIGSDIGSGSVANNPADITPALTIAAINDAPTVNRTATTLTIASTAPTAVTGFSITDVDSTNGYVDGETDGVIQATVRLLDAGGNPLSAATYAALGVTLDSSTPGTVVVDSTYTGSNGALELRGTLSEINAYLAGLRVAFATPGSSNVDTTYSIEVVADDRLRDGAGALIAGGNGGTQNQQTNLPNVPATDTFDPYATKVSSYAVYNVTTNTRPLFISSINDPAAISAANVTVDEGSATLVLNATNANVSIADPDDNGSTAITATVTVSKGTISAVGGSGGSVAGTGTATITITGATEAQINSRLQALTVTYPGASADWNGNFTVTVVYNDAGSTGTRPDTLTGDTGDATANPGDYAYADGASNILVTTRTFTVTVNGINDAPTRTAATVSLPAATEDTDGGSGDTVINLFGAAFSDGLDAVAGGSSAGNMAGIAITTNDAIAAQGKWQYSTDGSNWSDLPAVGTASAFLLKTTDYLRFAPAANFHGTPGGLGARLVDDSNGAITTGTTADVTTSGGTTRYSDSSNAVALTTTVANVNDRPTGANRTLSAIVEDSANPPGATVAALGFGYGDATDNQTGISGGGNAATAFGGIAVVGNAANASTEGVWQYNTGSGWVAIGTPSDASALLLPTTAQLRFLANADYNGSPGILTLRVSDTALVFNADSDISGSLGITSQWSNTVTLATTVDPRNDAPSLTATATSPTVTENNQTASGYSIAPTALLQGITLADIDLSTTPALSGTVFGSGTITVGFSDAYVAGDVLFIDPAALGGALPAGVSTSGGTAAALTINLAGGTTVDEVQALLAAIRYKNTGDDPTLHGSDNSRSYQLSLSDGNNLQAGGNAGGATALSAPPINGVINIVSANDPPINSVPGAQTVAEDGTLAIGGLAVIDPENSLATVELTVTHGSVNVSLAGGAGISAGGNGSSALTLSGSQAQINAALATVNYLPAADYYGPAQLTVTSTDTDGGASIGTVAIDVTPVADITPETLTTAEDTPISFNPLTGSNGAAADSFEGPLPQISAINGTAISIGGSVAVSNGTVTLGVGNLLTFTPASNFYGQVPVFTYTVSSGGATETADIAIDVTPVPDPPLAVDDRFTAIPGQAATIAVLNNDSDPENDSLTVTAINGTPIANAQTLPVQNGEVKLNADGTLTFRSSPGFAGDLRFDYTISDGHGGFASASVFGLIVNNAVPPDNLWTAGGVVEPLTPLKLPVLDMELRPILPVITAVTDAEELNGMTAIGDRTAHPLGQSLQRFAKLLPFGDRLGGLLDRYAVNRGVPAHLPVGREIDRVEHLFAYDDLAQHTSFGGRSSWDVGSLRHSVTVIPQQAASVGNGDFLSVHTTRSGALLYVELEHTVEKRPGYDVKRCDVRLADGRPLPKWLSFDPVSGVATGIPPAGGEIVKLLVATELEGGRVLSSYVEVETDTARVVELKVLDEQGAGKFSDQVAKSAGHFDAEAARLRIALRH